MYIYTNPPPHYIYAHNARNVHNISMHTIIYLPPIYT